MMVSAFIFYLFAVTAVVMSFMVVISKNPSIRFSG